MTFDEWKNGTVLKEYDKTLWPDRTAYLQSCITAETTWRSRQHEIDELELKIESMNREWDLLCQDWHFKMEEIENQILSHKGDFVRMAGYIGKMKNCGNCSVVKHDKDSKCDMGCSVCNNWKLI